MFIKRLNKDFSLLDKNFVAHRGIYGYSKEEGRYISPNSFEAFKIAIDNNIPFECDVRNTLDNVPVLSHDNVIELDGKKIKINKYKYDELCNLLKDKAPSKLEDVLNYNSGKVGVVVDAKEAHIFYSVYRNNLINLLNKYSRKGEILLQSFNPFFMLSTKKYLKNVLTGQLICRAQTILDSFRAPKSLAHIYERIISIICFIAGTDVINMENHCDRKWQKRTRYFISPKTNDKVSRKWDKLINNIKTSLYNGERRLSRFNDKLQLKLVKFAHDLTKKPVIAFTIEHESEFDVMDNLYIVNYIVDFSKYGVEKYIQKLKSLSKQ